MLFVNSLLQSPKRPPPIVYIFQQNGRTKNPKGSRCLNFWHCATYRRFQKKIENPHWGIVEENSWHFEVFLLFLSLRYDADLGRPGLFFVAGRHLSFYSSRNLSKTLTKNVLKSEKDQYFFPNLCGVLMCFCSKKLTFSWKSVLHS